MGGWVSFDEWWEKGKHAAYEITINGDPFTYLGGVSQFTELRSCVKVEVAVLGSRP